MKKVLFGILIIGISINGFSQESSGDTLSNNEDTPSSDYVFNEGDLFLNLGVSFGNYSYFGYYGIYPNISTSFTPPLFISVEYGIDEMFGVGGFLGYQSRKYTYKDSYYINQFQQTKKTYTYTDKYSFINYGLMGSAHLVKIANEEFDAGVEEDKIDVYLTLFMGFRTSTYKHTSDDPDNRNIRASGSSTTFNVGASGGMRYMFDKNFGAFLELGRGYAGWATIGVTYKPGLSDF